MARPENMRRAHLLWAWMAVCTCAPPASGQAIGRPAPLPSMVGADQYILEEVSETWYPPPSPPQPMFASPVIPLGSAPSGELPQPRADLPIDGRDRLAQEDAALSELAPWLPSARWFGPLPWDTAIELGLNGSSGTNEALSIRTGGYTRRESRFSKLDVSGYYNSTSSRGQTTQNNATLDLRHDWLLDDTWPWTLFGAANLFYDQFRAFDVQMSAITGVGYRFVYEPALKLIGRLGAGTLREFGGPDDRWIPESLVGFECSQQLSSTQKVYGKLDYFPEWDQIGEFRIVADVGWEVVLVEPSNLSLKISATDRYDSTPDGANPHLLNYSALLLLKL